MIGLFHRLVAHPTIGFGPDFLGPAELPNGSVTKSREILADLWLKDEISAVEVNLNSRLDNVFKAIVIGEKSKVEGYTENQRATFTISPHRGLRADNPKILGWMRVDTDSPIFIIRDDENMDENFHRLQEYLKPFVDKIKEAADKAAATLAAMRSETELAEVDDGRYEGNH